jgi:hypothetical protein
MELLFKEFLSTLGIEMKSVSLFYYKKLTKKTFTKPSGLWTILVDFTKFLRFLSFPLLWSRGFFKKSGINPRYIAILQVASSLVIILPIFLYKFLRSFLLTLWLASISVIFILFQIPYISKRVL